MQKDDLAAGFPFGQFAVPREQVSASTPRAHHR